MNELPEQASSFHFVHSFEFGFATTGFLLQKELDYLDGAVSNPKRPFAAIVGGSKVPDSSHP